MEIYHGDCSVTYHGRGNTILPEATRIVIVKKDGSVAVHNDKGFKPLNYMNAPTIIKRDELSLIVTGKRDTLTITFNDPPEIIELNVDDNSVELQRYHTEDDLQAWLAQNLDVIKSNLSLYKREYDTGDGLIDIMALDGDTGSFYAIEVKRGATTPAAHQLKRYHVSLQAKYPHRTFIPILAAETFTPTCISKLESMGYHRVTIPASWGQEEPTPETTLFDL